MFYTSKPFIVKPLCKLTNISDSMHKISVRHYYTKIRNSVAPVLLFTVTMIIADCTLYIHFLWKQQRFYKLLQTYFLLFS